MRTDPAKRLRLWPFWITLTIVVALGLLVSAGSVALLWLGLSRPKLGSGEPLATADQLDLVRIALIVTGGLGGVVALVVAYRRQRVAEDDSRRENTKLYNERFISASTQLGNKAPAVRLAGVYAIAALADDWQHQRQSCVDVLCAYLRMPYRPDRIGEREVRLSTIQIIADHLRLDRKDPRCWQGLDFDFTGADFDGGNFQGATFSGGTVSFRGATFSGGVVSFGQAAFSGSRVSFSGSTLAAGTVSFTGASFSDGRVSFDDAAFSGARVVFDIATFSGGNLSFRGATFLKGQISLDWAKFLGCRVTFVRSSFAGATVTFVKSDFHAGTMIFDRADFVGGVVDFRSLRLRGGTVDVSSPDRCDVPPLFDLHAGLPPKGFIAPETASATRGQVEVP